LTDDRTLERDLGSLLVGPVFEPIRRDPTLFGQVRVEHGTVVWPGDIDLCPDVFDMEWPAPSKRVRDSAERCSVVPEIQTTDENRRISLPATFANCAVIVEQINETEVRIRKAEAVPEDGLRFLEELPLAPLSDRDRDLFLSMLDNPPPPNEALKRAAARHRERVVDR
jgi:hypothetical protein